MKRGAVRVIALASALLSVGCAHTTIQEQRLPTYSAATEAERVSGVRTKLILEDAFDPQMLPEATPFLKLVAHVGPGGDEWATREMWWAAEKLGTDFIVVAPTESSVVGSISTYWGFGVSSTSPVIARSITGLCFRVRPSRHGITTDDNGMVLAMENEARKSGVLEGDTLMSIDGNPWRSIGKFPSAREVCLLGKKPGQNVELVWVRQGTGRMTGVLPLGPNPHTHASLEDPIPYKPEPLPTSDSASSW